jgi:hypothetical protein
MKKLFHTLFGKLLAKAIDKSVNDEVSTEVLALPETESPTLPGDNAKKARWKFIIQTLINILAAVLTALGTTSCINHIL